MIDELLKRVQRQEKVDILSIDLSCGNVKSPEEGKQYLSNNSYL